ncbi:MAG: hypothetical protein ABSF44_06770 [Candidatus Bathyarchaeia archaeon]|jgi:hypothetical protein
MITGNISEEELCSFIKSEFLSSKLREKDALSEIERRKKSDPSGRWDTHARPVIGEKMKDWFIEYFGSRTLGDKWENCFDYEKKCKGQNQTLERSKIFSCKCYPDMFFLKPMHIALELDHGTKGSQIKNALTKAGFDGLSDDWKKVFLLFFDESKNRQIEKSIKEKGSQRVLEFYQSHLNTEVIVI